MALDDLKDRVKEVAAETWSRIEASPLYSNIKEKYETLTPTAQKGVISGLVVLIVLFLLYFPLSNFSTSSTNVEDFEANRGLLRNLLRASRLASNASSAPAAFSVSDLKSQLQNQVNNFALQAEQQGGTIDIEASALGTAFAPSGIIQNGVGLSLKKINLKQIVDIGFELQKLNPSVKIAGMEIAASTGDPHYFDVLYKMIIFSMPESKSENENTKPDAKIRPSRDEAEPIDEDGGN